MLFLLFAACREGMFGRNCQQPCGSDLNCKGLRFCLPDPYGCSCASGWMGTRCETRKCENNGILSSRFLSIWHVTALAFSSFCQPALRTCMDQTADWAVNARMVEFASVSVDAHVPQGGEDKAVRNQVGFTFNPLIHYFQQHLHVIELWCMRRRTSWACKLGQNLHFFFFPDWAPQILELEGNLEWNLNSTPKIFCSATGNPLPSHNSIELRKLDSTVLKVENADKIYRVHAKIH